MAEPASKEAVTQILDTEGPIADTLTLATAKGWDHNKLVGSLKSLEALSCIKTTATEVESLRLTGEGEAYAEKGSPEAQVFNFVKAKSGAITQADVIAALGDVAKVGFGAAMKAKWISLNKEKQVDCSVDSIVDDVQAVLKRILAENGDVAKIGKDADALKKRKMVSLSKVTTFKVEKGENFTTGPQKKAMAKLTAEMLADGSWKDANFKVNLNALGAEPEGGHLHPLLKVRKEIRNILLLMGFEEMPTNQFVESSFWNFDALFQPQQHPARDAHDTFFCSEPATTDKLIPMDYLNRVKEMHEKGGQGSIGWRYDWSEAESRKNILRTHTTAVSSRILYQIGQEYQKTKVWRPRKCFSIDRVFRNETLDATHLAEFHQVEGFVADKNIGLGHLIGVIKEFFRRMGITDLEFKPAYNPYTEPSMEIFGYHPQLKKRIEIGNSGVFRPEMLLPMGLPEDISVIAWGISVERPTMIQYGINNIRKLFGNNLDYASLKTNPIAWYTEAEAESVEAAA